MTPGSFVRLGWYFVRQLVGRLFGGGRGLERFEEAYCRDEHLLPVSREDRESLHALSRCIACGMCDARFEAWGEVDRSEFRGPSDLPLSSTRSLPDYDALARYLTELRKGDLERLERVCPVRVPFRRLADFAERRAAALSGRS
ncbi:MAG: hypothetical protein ACOCUS_01955 [Polyangiales bacterium]